MAEKSALDHAKKNKEHRHGEFSSKRRLLQAAPTKIIDTTTNATTINVIRKNAIQVPSLLPLFISSMTSMPSRIKEAKLPTSKTMPSQGISGDGLLANSMKNNIVAKTVEPVETDAPNFEMYGEERS
ncbi:hypothetical protein [Pseudooceanicola sp. 200-1SW]|uniref:hypothetical protein n=1 Tax=Pseudooceanicola sp. 200-1SW TaxID=3425949 RepID=UPI003D7F8264